MGQQSSQHQCKESKNYIRQNEKYKLLLQSSIKQPELCQAISISQDSNIVIAASNCKIRVFKLSQDLIKQIQVLQEHKGYVDILCFMNKFCSFISASSDNSIIIWQLINDNKFIIQKKLLGHTYYIRCMIINIDDNLIISSGCDKTIRFWSQDNFWDCSQIIKNNFNWVYALSLNEQSNYLISCGDDLFILVFKYSQDNHLWIQTQKIQTEFGGFRLCFVNDNFFIFQPIHQQNLQIFQTQNQDQPYEKINEIKINGCHNDTCFFPSQYIKQKQILIFKNGCFINIIRRIENNQFILDHSIQFEHNSLFGSISSDGKYLITWDNQSQQIQVRIEIE
ncbi:unnamed protein product [Paramecium sonneborni]|uniref:Uncharacterized protein n=1 Tax=Paramecium sonneborni TaxID=65129 RepID=A0A8S1R2B1_9CILI|nr:unnamed protein product [Paramecium sonneborni]